MSIAGVSSSALQALLDSELTQVSTSSTGQTASTSAISSSTSSDSTNTSSTSSLDPLTQDLVSLLKALASGDVTAAKSDLTQLQKDLNGSSDSSSSGITNDLTSLLKDLSSGNTSAAKSDLSQLSTDLKAEEAGSSTSSNTNGSPLDQLVGKLSNLLNSGSTEGALQAVASYLVQQGHGTGTLVNTSA